MGMPDKLLDAERVHALVSKPAAEGVPTFVRYKFSDSNLVTDNTVAPAQNAVYHSVNKGETLLGIAAKYKTIYQRLAKENVIKNPHLIYPGQRIRIK